MKSSTFITLSFLICCGTALANVPVKKPLQYYSKLWNPSPFTTPPPEKENEPVVTVFNDYHLTAIAPIEGGHIITITNKKSKEKITIQPGSDSKFQVVKVERNPDVNLGTVVTLSDGNTRGEVRFEPNLVVLNTPTNAKPAEQQLPPGVDPNQQTQPNNGQAAPTPQPRPRIVAPTNPAQNPAKNGQTPGNNNSQTRPPRTR